MSDYIIVSVEEGYPINCPQCNHRFGIKQRKGGGTYYANKIKQLTNVSMMIIRWWVHGFPDAWLTTREAYRMFRQHAVENQSMYTPANYDTIVSCKMASFVARMSEMTGLKIFFSTGGERRLINQDTQTVKNISVSKYKINTERAWKIIEANGKIDQEPQPNVPA